MAEGASPSVYLKQLVDFGLSDDELFRKKAFNCFSEIRYTFIEIIFFCCTFSGRVKSRFRGGRFFWQTKWLSINLSNTQTLVRIMKGE